MLLVFVLISFTRLLTWKVSLPSGGVILFAFWLSSFGFDILMKQIFLFVIDVRCALLLWL
jgi:hypothetical protein